MLVPKSPAPTTTTSADSTLTGEVSSLAMTASTIVVRLRAAVLFLVAC